MPMARAISLALRAAHLVSVAILLGGHAAGAPSETLFPWLVVAVATGAGLIVPEVFAWGLRWFSLAKGVSVLTKLVLLLAIPFVWEARVPILVVAVVWAALTAHMPARLRNYSFVHGRVLDPGAPLPSSGRPAPRPPAN